VKRAEITEIGFIYFRKASAAVRHVSSDRNKFGGPKGKFDVEARWSVPQNNQLTDRKSMLRYSDD
jgi:hypothetical protein